MSTSGRLEESVDKAMLFNTKEPIVKQGSLAEHGRALATSQATCNANAASDAGLKRDFVGTLFVREEMP